MHRADFLMWVAVVCKEVSAGVGGDDWGVYAC